MRRFSRFVCVFALTIVCAVRGGVLYAQSGASYASAAPLTPDQVVAVSSLLVRGEVPQWSLDGSRIMYASSLDGALWTVPAAGGMPQRLTTSAGSHATYSPDGQWIAFTSEKDGSPELYLWSAQNGREIKLTKLGGRIISYSWSPDSRSIALAGDRYGSYDIWKVSVPDGRATRLTSTPNYEVFPAWTPDGATIVYVRMDDGWKDHDVLAMDANGGGSRVVVNDKDFFDYRGGSAFGLPMPSPDGKSVLFRSQRAGWTSYFIVPLAGGEPRAIDAEGADQSDATWSHDGKSVAYISNHNGTLSLRVVPAAGGKPRVIVDPRMGVASVPQWSPDDKRISYTLATATSPADLYVVDVATGTTRQLTNSEQGSLNTQLIVPEKVTYPSTSGFTISAYLYRPAHLKAGEHAPGIMYIHGGPTGQFDDNTTSQIQPQYLAQQGYAVLAPNIRGSSGYGRKFEDANNHCWERCDLEDVLAGVDYLKKLPYVNAEKMGITGISYGGIMTMASVAFAPGVFQAAMPQSGYADWVHFFDFNEELGHVKLMAYEFGPFPDSIASYKRSSPIYEAKNVTTPTFIIHGEGATTAWRPGSQPVSAGLDFARALDRNSKIFRYKTYPNEGYYIYRKENQRQVLIDMLAFFDQFLRDGAATAPTPLKTAATGAGSGN